MAALAQTSVAIPARRTPRPCHELLAPVSPPRRRRRDGRARRGLRSPTSSGRSRPALGRFDEAEACLTEASRRPRATRGPAAPRLHPARMPTRSSPCTAPGAGRRDRWRRDSSPRRARTPRATAARRAGAEAAASHRAGGPSADAAPTRRRPGPRATAVLRKEGDYWRARLGAGGVSPPRSRRTPLPRRADRQSRARDPRRRPRPRRRADGGARAIATTNGGTELAADLGRRSAPRERRGHRSTVQAELASPRPFAGAPQRARGRAPPKRPPTADRRGRGRDRRAHRTRSRAAPAPEPRRDRPLADRARPGERDARHPSRDPADPGERPRASAATSTVTIKTGTFCSYVPDPELAVAWQL